MSTTGNSLAGKVALITGATSGVGRAIAKGWAARGAAVVATGRREEPGKSLEQDVRQADGQLMFEGGVARGGEVERLMRSRTPLARIADPSEMAAAAVFFASDDASFVTGQTLFVDGGRTVLSMTVPVSD